MTRVAYYSYQLERLYKRFLSRGCRQQSQESFLSIRETAIEILIKSILTTESDHQSTHYNHPYQLERQFAKDHEITKKHTTKDFYQEHIDHLIKSNCCKVSFYIFLNNMKSY